MVKSAGVSFRKRAASARCSSRLTPMMTSPAAEYFCCMPFIQGKEWRQGLHQEAQKSRYTTLPRYWDRSSTGSAAEVHTGRAANNSNANNRRYTARYLVGLPGYRLCPDFQGIFELCHSYDILEMRPSRAGSSPGRLFSLRNARLRADEHER